MPEQSFPPVPKCSHHDNPEVRNANSLFLADALSSLRSCQTSVTVGRVIFPDAQLHWFVEEDNDGTDLGEAPVIEGHEVLILRIGEHYLLIHDCPDQDADLWVRSSKEQVASPYRLFENRCGQPPGYGFAAIQEVFAYIAENREGGPRANRLLALDQRLLGISGCRLVPVAEPPLQELLTRGEVFDGEAEFVPGERGRCHHNVAKMWAAQRAALSIVTGYALGSDGQWRAHSWFVRKLPTTGQRHLIDTTFKVVQRYYGVILKEEEAELFCLSND